MVFVLWAFFTPLARAAFPAPLGAPAARGAVAADSELASRVGAGVLAKGGNAIDAAVATALALGVVSPAGSGLGGGGFLVHWSARDHKATVLDFRETAPAAATRDMYVVDGKAAPDRSRWGGLAVAVPGEPAGLFEAHAKFGKLPFAQLVAPSLALASGGFPVSHHLASSAARMLERLGNRADDSLRALLQIDGRIINEGEKLKRAELAHTLDLLGQKGAAGFYQGAVARELVAAVRKRGGILTEQDLLEYRPLWHPALEGHYRGHALYGAPPPAGGATAIEALQILDARPPLAPLGAGSSAAYHQIAEALKHAFADRARAQGDPAFVDVPTARLVDAAYARELAARISDDKVQKPEGYGGKWLSGAPADPAHDHGTSHLCVVDGAGDAVALTTTINLGFGAAFVGGATGVVANDEMDDFSAQPGVPNAYGLIGGFANAIAPGKRPLSSMTPLIVVKDGRAVMCAGGSGGPLIASETVQVVVNVIDFGMDAEAAVAAPRIHAQWVPDVLIAEPEIPADVLDGLKRRGHKVTPPPVAGGSAAQAIVVRGERLEAASDPRKGGAPAAP